MSSLLPLLLLLPFVMLLGVYAVTRHLAARRTAWLRVQGGFAEGSVLPAQITPAMLDRGLKKAMICATVIIVVARGVLRPMAGGQATRGAVLLDCGPHPTRWLVLLIAVLAFGRVEVTGLGLWQFWACCRGRRSVR